MLGRDILVAAVSRFLSEKIREKEELGKNVWDKYLRHEGNCEQIKISSSLNG